jgi:molecular chaperone DnaK (HSP70)
MFAVGIDLGTTNSAVAVLKGRPVIVEDNFGNRTTASAVGWDADLEELLVGQDAKENPDMYGTVLSVKRKMGTDERIAIGPHRMLPEEVSAEILKALKQQVEEKTGEEVTDAIITVPAHFQMAATAATKRAGELAGLNVRQLLEEPSAAIMAYGPSEDEKILVYDLGGGTFDVTIVDCFAGTLKTLAVFGNNHLGGDDFDSRLVQHLIEIAKKEHGMTIAEDDPVIVPRLKKAAEQAKIVMSRKKGAKIEIPTLGPGTTHGLSTLVKTEDFEAMIRDLVETSMGEVEKALNHAKLDKRDVNTILLVGGSTYVPLVQRSVEEFFGRKPNKEVNPDLAVSLGAAQSLVATNFGPSDDGGPERHVVTVDNVPPETPDDSLEIEGRSSAGATIRVTGGAESVETVADDEGYYSLDVPLKAGASNALVIVATHSDGRIAKLEAEPIVQDENAAEPKELVEPPASRLSRALSISHALPLGDGKIVSDCASSIIPPQSDMPKEVSRGGFCTSQDNQRELMCMILEGDLPLASCNARLAELRLQLPPNVPKNEPVTVIFTIDENKVLTAEIECMNRRGQVIVDLKSPTEQRHLFDELENLANRIGNKIRPEEKARIEQRRITLEDVAQQIRNAKDDSGTDPARLFESFERFRKESIALREEMASAQRKYT